MSKAIKIKYHRPDLQRIEKLDVGNWIDLRCAEDEVVIKAWDWRLISLGVSMQLPSGYEAHIVPRSSTFKSFGLMQWNHFGVIDNSYSGDGDIWKFTAVAFRDTVIRLNDRICQFRISRIQPEIHFEEVPFLTGTARGGFGSTGKN